jgi:PIN domain nuclease of toxin-antitoxin system
VKLLLDAHILLWALYEPERLADRTRNAITLESNELFVSLATLWEIANKAATHRLPLAGSSLEHIIERIEELGVVFLPLLQSEIVAAAMLPRHHADPFDRILIAQAKAYSLTLVTVDTDIMLYDVTTLWR